ncbi:uncharacterized protein LOC142172545 [Nicotiana tabacum]|uniref:Uncharacterized protein LOC142172545 n=1 Tax=Nicotiana tabacum TaxID=4097 RepID=A0AC58T4Y0_TOBAC
MRPISLSNFVNKIFSRVIHERLVDILPNLISEEQADFLKGRSIVKNLLLTQEIITDIRSRTKAGPNVVIKIDMTKAYDRLSWLFLTKMLRKIGFPEAFIGLIFDLIGNNWYSILVNGQPKGFFKLSRGVKQGDPLSPTLFILAVEALSRGLNSLHSNLYFCEFGLPKWSPKINHLSYADDTIIFCSSDTTSLRLVMEILHAYEISSGQLVNKAKSAIYMHHLTDNEVINKVERITGIGRQGFLLTYLFGIDEDIHNVNDLVENGMWNVERIFEILPEDLAQHIVQNIRPSNECNELDTPFWMLETRGYFSVWKAKLPLDDFMRKLGYFMPSKFWCCAEPKEESLVHLFYTSNATRIVWSYFLRRAGIAVEELTLQQAITKCWTTPVIQRLKPIMQALPIKANTDGASRGNPGRSAIGICLRDDCGDIRYAAGREIKEGSNNEAEVPTIVEAMTMCRAMNFNNIWLQKDLMMLKNIIDGPWKTPWNIVDAVEKIKRLKEGFNFKVSHIFREGNKLADHLENYALDSGSKDVFMYCVIKKSPLVVLM